MLKLAECIANCLIGYIKASNLDRGNFEGVISAVTLAKCFRANLWENSPYVSKQMPDIETDDAIALVKNEICSFQTLSKCSPHIIEFVSIHLFFRTKGSVLILILFRY